MFLYCIFFFRIIFLSSFLFRFALNLITTETGTRSGLPAHLVYVGSLKTGGGQKRLPKFKFSAKFPIGLHVILQIQIKKFENDCYIM